MCYTLKESREFEREVKRENVTIATDHTPLLPTHYDYHC
jgi:hypothetical protein